MVHCEPYSGKWHSSSNQMCTMLLVTNSLSFFIFLLHLRVSLCKQWTRFPSSESQLFEHALTLTDSEDDAMLLVQVMTEESSVPEVLSMPKITGRLPQVLSPMRSSCCSFNAAGRPCSGVSCNPANMRWDHAEALVAS